MGKKAKMYKLILDFKKKIALFFVVSSSFKTKKTNYRQRAFFKIVKKMVDVSSTQILFIILTELLLSFFPFFQVSECRMYINEFPEVDDVVMAQVILFNQKAIQKRVS